MFCSGHKKLGKIRGPNYAKGLANALFTIQIGPLALVDPSPTYLYCYYDWAPNVAGIAISY